MSIKSLATARSLDTEIRDLARGRNTALAQIAELLAVMKKRQLFRNLGYESVGAYGSKAHQA